MREPRKFHLKLTDEEAERIREPAGQGGHQNLHSEIMAALSDDNEIEFSDEQLGKILRYMTQYKGGGFQGRLKFALERPIREILGFN